jgi:Zn-dependent M28 family amino/carboxypeptidase
MKEQQARQTKNWNGRIARTGHTRKTLPAVLEEAGAAGIVTSNWSKGFGANKIFAAYTRRIPSVDVSLEDYGLLYRLAESGNTPRISIRTDSKNTGTAPVFNTLAEIRGTEKPDEYIILSAHFDSWDGATGATDNGTGTLIMMETMRILKKLYPHPKRTIIAGHWAAEEHGLRGSKAFVEDHPEIVKNIQVVFNQDNGTGRVITISGQGFADAYDYLGRWLDAVPKKIKDEITTTFPGMPARGSSDHSSFVTAGAPAFYLSSLNWAYGAYTWHTNKDTYDKIVFDDVRSNVILTAILTYMASEDPERTSNKQRLLPVNPKTGQRDTWPEFRPPVRKEVD